MTKRLGKMDMVVRTSYSSEIMWIYGANPIATPTIEMNSMECVCLRVHLYKDIIWLFWGGGGGGLNM